VKRFFSVIAILLIFTGIAFAQTWHTVNQATVAWDAVTALDNGDPLPAGDTIEYVVYLANAITDPNKDNPSEIETITATQSTITLNVEGSYFVGVKAVRKIADGTNVGESEVAWSDDPQFVQGGATFGLRYFLPPAAPGNMRPV
jgi:hypothetical protein